MDDQKNVLYKQNVWKENNFIQKSFYVMISREKNIYNELKMHIFTTAKDVK